MWHESIERELKGKTSMHIHVKETCEAKIWLSDSAVAINLGFATRGLREVVRTIRAAFLEAWNDDLQIGDENMRPSPRNATSVIRA